MTPNYDSYLSKVIKFCAYRERCSSEVLEKLNSLNCNSNDSLKILKYLKDEKYVDDKRFAVLYAGSKHRINKWGKIKIKNTLTQKKIAKENIESALKSIDSNEYFENLKNIINKKKELLKIKDINYSDIFKLRNYALQKGYEYDLVSEVLMNI